MDKMNETFNSNKRKFCFVLFLNFKLIIELILPHFIALGHLKLIYEDEYLREIKKNTILDEFELPNDVSLINSFNSINYHS